LFTNAATEFGPPLLGPAFSVDPLHCRRVCTRAPVPTFTACEVDLFSSVMRISGTRRTHARPVLSLFAFHCVLSS